MTPLGKNFDSQRDTGRVRRIVVWLLLTLAMPLPAAAEAQAESSDPRVSIELPSGFELQVLEFPAAGRELLIWLPSKYGIRPGNRPFAETVQAAGIDYWLVDLHESYLAPTGRQAYAEFDPAHVKALIDHAVAQGWKRIVLGGASRGAALAMRAARLWQLDNPGDPTLNGMLFYHPYLIEGRTEIGEQASFHPIARATNLPVYIFQPEFNSKHLHSRQLITQLESGGAPVYFHYLDGVRGGFHLREPDLLSVPERDERARLGARFRNAIRRLAALPTPPHAAELPAAADAPPADSSYTRELVAVAEAPADVLRVQDAQGRIIALDDFTGEVVLVNFWASWCGPCVREIASLMRLVDELEDRPFRVLTVNIGEDPAHVRAFLDEIGVTPNFAVLFDPDRETARDWRIYAVPSTYLLDARHRVRFGYRGALRWDKPSVVATVRSLLDEIDTAAR